MRWVVGALILLAVAAVFVTMARTWRSRSRAQTDLAPPVPVPAGLGAAVGVWHGHYVATTRADAPLERIAAGPWGFRGRGAVAVHPEGVVLTLAGAPDRFLPWHAVRGADRATWAIDRVVEAGGLVRLRWSATGAAAATDLDTYYRFPQGDAAVLAALQGPTDTTSSTMQSPAPTTGTGAGSQGERTP